MDEKKKPELYTIRVRGEATEDKPATDPRGLSLSILHVLHENPRKFCRVMSVGKNALFITQEAFRLAANIADTKAQGQVLVMRQSDEVISIGDNPKAKRVVTRIFPVDITQAK